MSIGLFDPVRSVLRRCREVLASSASGGLSPSRIGTDGVAEAGAVFLAVDAETPVAHAEREAGVGQHAGIGVDAFLQARASEARTLSGDILACAPAQGGCREHVFPSAHGLLENLGIDLPVEAIVGSAIVRVGDGAFTMAEVLGDGEQGRAVAQRGETHEGLAPLMGCQAPRLAAVVGQIEPRGESSERRPHERGR